ncbi:interleukin-13 isoform 1-T1 [Trichechus inunguis]
MALWLTVVIALTCVGGLASPVPVYYHHTKVLQELIGELINITQNQKTPLCNGSMVWSVNLTTTNVVSPLDAEGEGAEALGLGFTFSEPHSYRWGVPRKLQVLPSVFIISPSHHPDPPPRGHSAPPPVSSLWEAILNQGLE